MIEAIAYLFICALNITYGTLILKDLHKVKKQQKFLERRIKEL